MTVENISWSRMMPTSAGVEPATSWPPVRRRIQLGHRGWLLFHLCNREDKSDDKHLRFDESKPELDLTIFSLINNRKISSPFSSSLPKQTCLCQETMHRIYFQWQNRLNTYPEKYLMQKQCRRHSFHFYLSRSMQIFVPFLQSANHQNQGVPIPVAMVTRIFVDTPCFTLSINYLLKLLMLSTLSIHFSRRHFKYFSYFFKENRIWHLCKLSPVETICIKCQVLFPRNNKKKYKFVVCWISPESGKV